MTLKTLRRTTKALSVIAVLGFGSGLSDRVAFGSPVEEVEWKLSETSEIYRGDPSGHRYRVLPRVVRMLDGTIVAQRLDSGRD